DLFILVASANPLQCMRYRFVGCVQATTTSALSASALPHLLDDRLLDEKQAGQVDGFQWWVKTQSLYPGLTLLPDSADAARWSQDTGVSMVEAVMETSVQRLSLVFHDLVVDSVASGSVPFRVCGGAASNPSWARLGRICWRTSRQFHGSARSA